MNFSDLTINIKVDVPPLANDATYNLRSTPLSYSGLLDMTSEFLESMKQCMRLPYWSISQSGYLQLEDIANGKIPAKKRKRKSLMRMNAHVRAQRKLMDKPLVWHPFEIAPFDVEWRQAIERNARDIASAYAVPSWVVQELENE